MRLPVIKGVIRRRILVNYSADAQAVRALLPSGFEPKLQNGRAVVGICLIRLEHIRPRFFPFPVGISSENAAHRIAVTWRESSGEAKEGVFIPRRDTGNILNHLAGGRLFPGEHHLARFDVTSGAEGIDFSMKSRDGQVSLSLRARRTDRLPASRLFGNLDEASRYFETGSLGYSVTRAGDRLDGIVLQTKTWKVSPLAVDHEFSSYYTELNRTAAAGITFDCALLMENIEHEWHSAADRRVTSDVSR